MSQLSEQMLREMVNDLFCIESGLTAWEIKFIENANRQKFAYTGKQPEKIEQIWDRLCGGENTHN